MEVPFAGVDSGKEEFTTVGNVLQSGWLAAGLEVQAFEQEFATFIGTKYAVCVNSGSSGLLLALKALQLPRGNSVLTAACGFPATLAPILHCGFRPIFVDYHLPSHNIDVNQAIEMIHNDKSIRAVIVAHTLGNPIELAPLLSLCQHENVALIEDCCEAVGTTYHGRPVGGLGRLGVFSFYPSHQMTALGGGGMVTMDDETLCTRIRSLRDWGKRYDQSSYRMVNVKTHYDTPLLGESFPYYWGYVYDEVGFNMKLPDANAAFGRVQLRKLPAWIQQRIQNFERFQHFIRQWSDRFLLIQSPSASSSSWFAFPMTFRSHDFLTRNNLGEYLEQHGIRHRPFFAGNLLRQPAFKGLSDAKNYPVADHLMNNSLFLGVWHKLTDDQLNYIEDTLTAWMHSQ